MEGAPKGLGGKTVEKAVEKLGEKAGGFLAKQALSYATAGLVGLTSVGDVLANPDASGVGQGFEDNQDVVQIKIETPKADLEAPTKRVDDSKGLSFEMQPEVIFSEETKNDMETIVEVLDRKILDLNYQVNRKKEDIEQGFDSALAEMNGCVSGIEKRGVGDFSKECRAQGEQESDMIGEYKAGQVTDENLLSVALHVRQIFHGYLDTYNVHREEWLMKQNSDNDNK